MVFPINIQTADYWAVALIKHMEWCEVVFTCHNIESNQGKCQINETDVPVIVSAVSVDFMR